MFFKLASFLPLLFLSSQSQAEVISDERLLRDLTANADLAARRRQRGGWRASGASSGRSRGGQRATPVPPSPPSAQPVKHYDPFTVVFFSDLEANYRGHTTSHARRVVEYLRDLKNEDLTFSNGAHIDPQLVIHGGDINQDGWVGCHTPWFWLCRTPEMEYDEIWNTLYDAGIPMISAWGNHDWTNHVENKPDIEDPNVLDSTNAKSMQFSRSSFEKSASLTDDFTYTKFATEGTHGPDTYRAMFRGLQIALFQESPFREWYNSNDKNRIHSSVKNARQLADSLDKQKTTMFVTHKPIDRQTTDERRFMIDTIKQFGKAAHFSGHVHVEKQLTGHQKDGPWEGYGFTDYVAAYPYKWESNEPGFYAVLVDPQNGIQEVKPLELKAECWARGEYCVPEFSCKTECCDHDENWSFWWGKGWTACGEETKWGAGTLCHYGTSCNQCRGGNEEVEGSWCWTGICYCK